MTGFSSQLVDINEKRLELLREILPRAKQFGLLGPGSNRSEPVDALLVASVLVGHNRQILDLSAKSRIPASYIQKGILEAGALVVFGPDTDAHYRRAADYAHRILTGTKPADLPVEQPKDIWLGVDLQTAKAFGLKVPQSVLVRADRVIE